MYSNWIKLLENVIYNDLLNGWKDRDTNFCRGRDENTYNFKRVHFCHNSNSEFEGYITRYEMTFHKK